MRVAYVFFFKQKTAYELRISGWSSDVCSSDLRAKMNSILHLAISRGNGKPNEYRMNDLRTLLVATLITLVASACATQFKRVPLNEPLRPTSETRAGATETLRNDAAARPSELRQTATPHLPGSGSAISGLDADERLPPLSGEPVDANIDGMALPAFINEAFGNLLGVAFQMDDALLKQRDRKSVVWERVCQYV